MQDQAKNVLSHAGKLDYRQIIHGVVEQQKDHDMTNEVQVKQGQIDDPLSKLKTSLRRMCAKRLKQQCQAIAIKEETERVKGQLQTLQPIVHVTPVYSINHACSKIYRQPTHQLKHHTIIPFHVTGAVMLITSLAQARPKSNNACH